MNALEEILSQTLKTFDRMGWSDRARDNCDAEKRRELITALQLPVEGQIREALARDKLEDTPAVRVTRA